MGFVYLGEATGARILRYGVGFTQVGDAYELEVEYHDAFPFGEAGEGVIRDIQAKIRHTNGYRVQVIAIVDGVVQPTALFTGGPPAGSLTEEIVDLSVPVHKRCNRIRAIVKTAGLLGEIEIVDCGYIPVMVREAP